MNIPYILYLIWLGNTPPYYIDNVILLYKTMNPLFLIKFIHFTLDDIEKIFYKKYNFLIIYVNELYLSMLYLISNIPTKYNNFILELKKIHKTNKRAILILSDIFRLEILNKYGGIYVDCDTIPINLFDNKLLSYNKFIVKRHYNTGFLYSTNIEYIDNYFIGSNGLKSGQITDPLSDLELVSILLTNKNWYNNIFYKYRKKLFYEMNITIDIIKKLCKQNLFYIEHYHENNWKKNILNKINTPTSFLDKYI